jgi:uncharacterized protein YukE
MSETSLTDLREGCEQAVVAAAREERAAHTALTEGSTPLHRNWCEEDKKEYEARLGRWRAASRTLVDALNRLGNLDERCRRPVTTSTPRTEIARRL